MVPVSPVIPGFKEIIYAKDQPEYNPISTIKDIKGQVLSRWAFSEEERKLIAEGADLFVCVHTFNKKLQPMALAVYSDIAVDASCVGILEDFNMGQIIYDSNSTTNLGRKSTY